MDIVRESIRKDIESLDKSILELHQMEVLSNIEKIEFIRQLRAKNESILDYFVNCRTGRSEGKKSSKAKSDNETSSCLQRRCNSHPRCVKFRKEYLQEKERRDLEELEELSKGEQFKARPPPSHIYLRLYSKMVDEKQKRKSKLGEQLTTAKESIRFQDWKYKSSTSWGSGGTFEAAEMLEISQISSITFMPKD
ncbi:hypothetical protein ECG_03186 [Echinococcus granulosus]|uniref:UPF0564 domain containing protein n=1 Tax=Echinococcus granulosus TaxID=6210 RepID=A0A068WQD1_ECHGR|nr:hypothetical protein ECG_03186 [Echinococcus granulosus]CDS19841.1 UPF0564 domain containing protein [Echinococcus granulosus]